MTEPARHITARKPAWRRIARDLREVADVARSFRRFGRPSVIVTFGMGVGDNLLCTVILRELRIRGAERVWMATDYPEIFSRNSDADQVVRASKWLNSYAKRSGIRFVHPIYAHMREDGISEDPPKRHIIGAMCEMASIAGPVTRRPYLDLTAEEVSGGRVGENQVVMHSSGMAARWPIPLKEWYPERFQAVAKALASQYTVVQLGSIGDPPLAGALDLRGKTTIRGSAAVLRNSIMFVGQVGALMHLARAAECRTVAIYGGREHPDQSGYTCNVNLYTAVACAPCWKREICPIERECMQRISVGQVLRAVESVANRRHEPLEVDVEVL